MTPFLLAVLKLASYGTISHPESIASASKWPQIAYEAPNLGRTPEIAKLEPLDRDLVIKSYRKDLDPELIGPLLDRFVQVLSLSPSSRLRTDMYSTVINMKLRIYFSNAINAPSFFFEYIPDPDELDESVGQKSLPAMFISARLLANAETPEDILALILDYDHEFSHYLQWLAAPAEKRVYFSSLKNKESLFSKDRCEQYWHNELEAYERECALAISWGLPDVVIPGLCVRLKNPKAFKQHLFFALSENSPGEFNPECRSVWLKLARPDQKGGYSYHQESRIEEY